MSTDFQAHQLAGPGPGLSAHPVFRSGILPQAQLQQGAVEVSCVQVSKFTTSNKYVLPLESTATYLTTSYLHLMSVLVYFDR